MGNAYFKHKSLYKYKRVARVKEHNRSGSVEGGYTALYAGCESSERKGLSNHHVELSKVRLVGAWINRIKVAERARRTRSEKLIENKYRARYVKYN